jgi:hypothetical protein
VSGKKAAVRILAATYSCTDYQLDLAPGKKIGMGQIRWLSAPMMERDDAESEAKQDSILRIELSH